MSPSLPVSPSLQPAVIHSEAPAASLPRFIIGQDHLGRWVAIETHGLAGGLFRSRKDAVHYAAEVTGGRPGAVAFPAERIEFRV
ncbi:hypothetical protein [Methylobacterium sp. ID0610]|uniref:hypothetical protein n=1 Tax=Methylobacterium carpenticola TaxID=3344827 RepID=UPI0036A87BE6